MTRVVKSLAYLGVWAVMLGHRPLATAGWKAGVARVDTTPAKPVRMAGYASRTAPSKGVAQSLFAKALALSDGNDHRVVMITCDVIHFRRPFTVRVADKVKAKYGVPRQDLVLFASHTHAGPALSEPAEPAGADASPPDGLENNRAYTRDLEDQLVDLVGAALARMVPARLSYGVGRAHFALNRREPTPEGIKLGKYPAGPTDESVPVLRVEDPDGKPLAIVFGYACHNTTLRPDMMEIAADYAGFAQTRVEADFPGAVALFVTGCAGDADPHPFGTLAMAKDHGEELAGAVKFVLDHPSWLTALSGDLRAAHAETTLHFAGPTDRASYEARLNDPNAGRKRHAKAMVDAIDKGKPIRGEYPSYGMHALALGDQLTMIALSGEVVVDYAIRLQRELGTRTLWVAAYADDVIGYIPSLRVLKEGGYEGLESFYGGTWPAPFADDVESIVVKTAHDVVEKVRGK